MKMNSFVHFLTILLIVLILSSVEARKVKNAKKVVTVDLIHHDSFLSPQKKLSWGKVSPRHVGRLSSPAFSRKAASDSSNNTRIDAQLTPDDVGAEYLIKLAIGTPPVEYTAIADTGSHLIWLQCTGCQTSGTCVPQSAPLFDPSASSTYKVVACDSPSCDQTSITTTLVCSSDDTLPNTNAVCLYQQAYADDANTTGILSTDTITFPSTDNNSSSDTPEFTLLSAVFGCGIIQNGNNSNSQGLVGLGAGPLSLVSQLGENKFSYCLVPRSPGASSKLKFGAEVTSPDVVSTPYLDNNLDVYPVLLNEVSVGNTSVAVGVNITIDSGTTLIWLPTSVYNNIKDAVNSSIGLDPLSDPDVDPFLCYKTQETTDLNPPDVVFHFNGANVVLKLINLFWEPADGFKCLAIRPTDGDLFLFGNMAQINFEVGYDLENKLISFAPTDCTTY